VENKTEIMQCFCVEIYKVDLSKIKIGCKVIQLGGVWTVWPNTGTWSALKWTW